MEGVMPQGWVVETVTRRAGTTLIMREKYNVAIENERDARAAVEQFTQGCYNVRIEALDPIPEQVLMALGLAPGDIIRL
jgi:hypothetical protein